MPRLTQHLVRRHNIQLVVHPAANQCTDDTDDEATHAGGNAATRPRWWVLRRLLGVMSVWHVNPTPAFCDKALLSYTQAALRRKSKAASRAYRALTIGAEKNLVGRIVGLFGVGVMQFVE